MSGVKHAIFLMTVLTGVVLAAAESPRETNTPQGEIASLREDLQKAIGALDSEVSLEGALVGFSAIQSRLDMFELRFGVPPQDIKGWADLRSEARRGLRKAETVGRPEPYFNADSAEVARCILLELSGNSRAALRRLESISPGGACGNWAATVTMATLRQRSGIYQRTGNYKKALQTQEQAALLVGTTLYFPEAESFWVRYAFLLAKTGYTGQADFYYQRVIDDSPRSAFAELARREMRTAGPEAVRSLGFLTNLVAHATAYGRNDAIVELGRLGDKRAIALLTRIVNSSDIAGGTLALAALHKLGDDSQIRRYAHRILATGNDEYAHMLHLALMDIYDRTWPFAGADKEPGFDWTSMAYLKLWVNWLDERERDGLGR
jgi:tetratricopeptide (TPR) repeat protein